MFCGFEDQKAGGAQQRGEAPHGDIANLNAPAWRINGPFDVIVRRCRSRISILVSSLAKLLMSSNCSEVIIGKRICTSLRFWYKWKELCS